MTPTRRLAGSAARAAASRVAGAVAARAGDLPDLAAALSLRLPATPDLARVVGDLVRTLADRLTAEPADPATLAEQLAAAADPDAEPDLAVVLAVAVVLLASPLAVLYGWLRGRRS